MNDDLIRYAAAHGHRFWGWLYRTAPDDFSQAIALAAVTNPSFIGMGNAVNRELNALARAIGFRRVGNGWSKDDQFNAKTHGTNMIKTLWKKGKWKKCQCEDCQKIVHRSTEWRRKQRPS